MKITLNQHNNRGFGLKELMFGLAALAVAAHFVSPSLTQISQKTGMKISETKASAHSLFRPVFAPSK